MTNKEYAYTYSVIKVSTVILLIINVFINCTQIEKNKKMKCYKTFDKFNFKGVNEIPCNKKEYPYISIQENEKELFLIVNIKEGISFDSKYLKKDNFIVKIEENYSEDEVYYPYSRKIDYYSDGNEYTFLYLLKKQDGLSKKEDKILAEFHHTTPLEKAIYEFPIFDEEEKIVLKQEIKFEEISAFKKKFSTNRIGIKKIHYKISDKKLFCNILYEDLSEENQKIETEEIYTLEKYPIFYLDFIAPLMFLKEVDK